MAFPTTRWTLVAAAKGAEAGDALAELLRAYWPPLYVLARVQRLSPADAQDAVQAFAEHVLEKRLFAAADPERGRLRHFLKAAFRNFLADAGAKARAQKRGGGVVVVDLALAEGAARDAGPDPERAYERHWAALVMQRALVKLEAEFASGRFGGDFTIVRRYFNGALPGLAEVARAHAMTEAQLKSLLHRARGRYRELLLDETRDTTDPQSAEAELQDLLRLVTP